MRRQLPCVLLLLAAASMLGHAASPPSTFGIAGVVVDALSGEPVNGATVTISAVASVEQTQTLLTSFDGRFRFSGLPSAKYRLLASRRGYAPQFFDQHENFMTAIVAGPGRDSEHLLFRLSPGAVLSGVVTDDWGDPVRGGRVLLFHQSLFDGSRTLRNIGETTTDDEGRYRFAHLLSGTYAVAVYAHPWYTRDQSIHSVARAELQSALVSDVDSAALSRVEELSSLAPLPDPIFDVVYPVAFFPNASRLADAARLPLAAGTTEIADFHLRAVPSIHLEVHAPVEPPITLTVPEGHGDETISVDSPADISASLHLGEGFSDELEARRREIAPGLVELSGIPPGEISLAATTSLSGSPSDTSYVWHTKTLDLSGDASVDLTPRGARANVSGVVVLANPVPGRAAPDTPPLEPALTGETSPPPSLTIAFRALSSGESYETPVSSDGRFSFPGELPRDSYEVGFSLSDEAQVSSLEATGATVAGRTVEVSAEGPVNLVVHMAQPTGTLSGLALNNGKPVAGAMILLVAQESGREGPRYYRAQSDSDGSFTLTQLFPGAYALLAIEDGWDLEWADPAVLFRYLPNSQPLKIPAEGAVTHNVKVQ